MFNNLTMFTSKTPLGSRARSTILVLPFILLFASKNAFALLCKSIFNETEVSKSQEALSSLGRGVRTPQFRSHINETLELVNYGNIAVLYWKVGPRAGQVYRVIRRPSVYLAGTLLTMKEINQTLSSLIRDYQLYPTTYRYGLSTKQRVYMYVYELFNGTAQRPGLKDLRYFDLEINDLVNTIESMGIYHWLRQKTKECCGNVFKHDYFLERSDYAIKKQISESTYTQRDFNKNLMGKLPDQIRLIHGTFSGALAGILGEGALKAHSARDPFILKITGERVDNSSANPDVVSFFDYLYGKVEITGGYYFSQIEMPTQFPIAFGITNKKAENLNVTKGYMSAESVVSTKVSLSNIDFLFVPEAEVENIIFLLRRHGYQHITVLPL